MKITIHTPMGSFTSIELTDITKEELSNIAIAFKKGQVSSFNVKGENQEYFFPEKVLENSVFVIED
jgi:hypothetical protein